MFFDKLKFMGGAIWRAPLSRTLFDSSFCHRPSYDAIFSLRLIKLSFSWHHCIIYRQVIQLYSWLPTRCN